MNTKIEGRERGLEHGGGSALPARCLLRPRRPAATMRPMAGHESDAEIRQAGR
jgi:hypothetical protein